MDAKLSKFFLAIVAIAILLAVGCFGKRTEINEFLTSTITGINYPVHIYLPADYDDTQDSYPVIYTTDGQWHFESYAKAIASSNKKIILVSIEQGPEGRRSTDYLLPGSHDYYQFLITELLPEIESKYRIDQSQRTLSGASFGGVFAALALLEEGEVSPHFENYLSFDGSFGQVPELIKVMEQQRFSASTEMNVTLMLTSALTAGNDVHVSQFQALLEARNYSGLNIIRRSFHVVHGDILPISFDEALELLY